jgi:hypothetical protein
MKNQNTSKKTGIGTAGSYDKSTPGTSTAVRTPGRRGRKPKQAKEKDDFSDLNFTWEGDAYETESAWDANGSKPAYGRSDDEDSDESYTNSYGRRRHGNDYDGYDSDSYESFRRG